VTWADPGFADFLAMTDAVVVRRVFDDRISDRDYAVDVFRRHIAEVKATVPADRLLVFDIAEGWSPLCTLLGVPVPDERFPYVNDAADFNRRQATQMRCRLLSVVKPRLRRGSRQKVV
jgi:hypothetical protein